MTDKVQKIREEVEKLKDQLVRGACASQIEMETNCKEEAYNEVLTILDSMQEEIVSIDLEKAAKDYSWAINKQVEIIKKEITTDAEITEIDIKNAYIAGADWQRRKMMGIDSYIEGPKGSYTTTTK